MRSFMTILPAFTLALTPTYLPAQTTSWWDVFTPDRLAESFLQYGIMAARTQVDLTYDALTVDALAGRAVLTEFEIYPLLDWDDVGDCKVTIDRVVLTTAPASEIQNLSFRASFYGLETHSACFPPDAMPVFAMAGLTKLALPHATLSLNYHIPSAGAQLAVHAVADDLLAIDLAADFDYLWIDGRADMENPEPVAFLNAASLSLENLGVWEKASSNIPPFFTDPASAPQSLGKMLNAALEGINRDASDDASEASGALNDAQRAFVESTVATLASFLADPTRVILETRIDQKDPAYLEFDYWENNPGIAFDVLAPRLTRVPAAAVAALPVQTIQAALSTEREGVEIPDQLAVGRALVSGVGAPRNVAAGVPLLVDLARNGNLDAAAALSEALELLEPLNSYAWALVAAAGGASGTTARLDRLERSLPFTDVLTTQAEVLGKAVHSFAVLESVATVKAEARARLTGRGKQRNYEVAAMWAMIAKAAGDTEGAALLEEIDGRIAGAEAESVMAWSAALARASDLAMEAWLGQDLPTRFGRD